MSNNALFLKFADSPFLRFFKRGLSVSLSTDDPMIFHLTEHPLLEEYSVARQIWGLSLIDLAEVAEHSVKQSGFLAHEQQAWIDLAEGMVVGDTVRIVKPGSQFDKLAVVSVLCSLYVACTAECHTEHSAL
jgi:adenosine deaminase